MTTGEDIEQRLAAATAQLHQYEILISRLDELRQRHTYTQEQLAPLYDALVAEERDIEKLEHLSLTRILASLRGARENSLERERAEADAARYRADEAEDRLDAIQHEIDAVEGQLEALESAPVTYDLVLAEKEDYLARSPDPRGGRLLALAEERGRLTDELREVTEATEAALVAQGALDRLRGTLSSASGWSTYDTYFGGKGFSSAMKHMRLDEAAKEAAQADRCLAVLRAELADVAGVPQISGTLAMDGLTRFLDVWFDNIFTDLSVRERIVDARDNVEACQRRIRTALDRLADRGEQAQLRLEAIIAERVDVLTR